MEIRHVSLRVKGDGEGLISQKCRQCSCMFKVPEDAQDLVCYCPRCGLFSDGPDDWHTDDQDASVRALVASAIREGLSGRLGEGAEDRPSEAEWCEVPAQRLECCRIIVKFKDEAVSLCPVCGLRQV